MVSTLLTLTALVLYGIMVMLIPLDGGTRALLLFVGTVLIGGLGLAIGTLYRQALRRRNQGTNEAFHQMAEGDLRLSQAELYATTQSAEVSLSIAFLAQILHRTIQHFLNLSLEINKASRNIIRISQNLLGSSSEQLASSEATSAILEEIHGSISMIHASIERLSQAAEDTASSILQMSASVEESSMFAKNLYDFVEETTAVVANVERSFKKVEQNLDEISSFAIETSSSMTEMNASIAEVEKRAKSTSQLGHETLGAARKGQDAVQSATEAVQGMQKVMQDALLVVRDLGSSSREIGDIVRVIEQITSQTNLLALNAAIIAAQAREKGRGFAVVADEIRDLSERTAVSTGEIGTLITRVQKGVESAIEAISDGTRRMESTVTQAGEAREAFANIFRFIERSSGSSDEIAKATEEQTRGSEQVTQSIERITSMIQEMAQASESLSKMANQVTSKSLYVKDSAKQILKSLDEQSKGSKSISAAVDTVQKGIMGLVQVSKQLKGSTNKILEAMEVLHRVNLETSAPAQILSSTAERLDSESHTMKNRLSTFHLPEPVKGGNAVMHLGWRGEYSFDPQTSTYIANAYVIHNVFDTLLGYGSGLNLENNLAEDFEVTDFGKTYVFHLRRGVRFHNGTELTAQDVKATFLRLVHPESRSHAKYIFAEVEGAEAYAQGKSRDIAGLQILDTHRVKISLRQPLSYFSSLLAMAETSILPKEYAEDFSTFGSRPVGAGPFTLENLDKDQFIRLKRFKDYYDYAYPHLDEVVFHIHPSTPLDRVEEFLRRENDILTEYPLSRFDYLKQQQVYFVPLQSLRTLCVGLNQSYEPLQDLRVRKALSYAVNRDRINREFFSGFYQPAQGILPPGMFGFSPALQGYGYDPEAAKTLLREAGYGTGLELSLWHPSTEKIEDTMLPFLIEDLAEVGVRVALQHLPPEEIQRLRREKKRSALFLTQWLADYPHPDNFFSSLFLSTSDLMQLHYRNPKLDDLVMRAKFVNDVTVREGMYQELDRMVVEDAPMVFLFYAKEYIFYQPYIHNLIAHISPPPVRFYEIWSQK